MPQESQIVLYIDDDIATLKLRKLRLEAAGFTVLTACTASEGLELFASSAADAVVVDFSMPHMDGGLVCAQIRRSKPRVPIIMVSGYSGIQHQAERYIDFFIMKDEDGKVLAERLHSLINARNHAHPELEVEYFVTMNEMMQFLDCSDCMCSFTGYNRVEFLNLTLPDVSYHPPDPAESFDRNLTGETILKHKAGRPLPVFFHAWVFPDGCRAIAWQPIHNWRELYHIAVLELDSARLKTRVVMALEAIHQRLRDLSSSSKQVEGTEEERRVLNHALSTLHVLGDRQSGTAVKSNADFTHGNR